VCKFCTGKARLGLDKIGQAALGQARFGLVTAFIENMSEKIIKSVTTNLT
jgi:hypothetical protein